MDPDPVELVIGSGCVCESEINSIAVSEEENFIALWDF